MATWAVTTERTVTEVISIEADDKLTAMALAEDDAMRTARRTFILDNGVARATGAEKGSD